MGDWINLLRPKVLTFKNCLVGSFRKSAIELLGRTSLGIGFLAIVFVIFQKALLTFRSMGQSGDLMSFKLLAIMLLLFFFTLLMSNPLTSLSTFFLSEDLNLILSHPVSLDQLYCARLVETIVYSSWIVLFFAIPFIGAY